MRLGQNFNNKVLGGRRIHMVLTSTATGTGSSTAAKVGVCCLDRSSKNWFICTVSAAGGTWVQLNA